jgi:hypothetical protein
MAYIEIPKEITTDKDKMAWSLRLVEKLRLEHNARGALVDTKDSIAVAEWHKWQREVFEPMQEEALMYANEAKQIMYKAETWDSKIDAKAVLDAIEADRAK